MPHAASLAGGPAPSWLAAALASSIACLAAACGGSSGPRSPALQAGPAAPAPAPASAPLAPAAPPPTSAPSPTATTTGGGHVSPRTSHDGAEARREAAVRYHERVWLLQVGIPLPYRRAEGGPEPILVRSFGGDVPTMLPVGSATPGSIAGTWATTWDVDVSAGVADECPGTIHEWFHVALFAAGVADGDLHHGHPDWARIDQLAACASARIALARGVTGYQWPSARARCQGEHDHGTLPGFLGP